MLVALDWPQSADDWPIRLPSW